MFISIKLTLFAIFAIASGLCFLIGYRRWKFAMQLVFGRKRMRKFTSTKPFAAAMYGIGTVLAVIALFILF